MVDQITGFYVAQLNIKESLLGNLHVIVDTFEDFYRPQVLCWICFAPGFSLSLTVVWFCLQRCGEHGCSGSRLGRCKKEDAKSTIPGGSYVLHVTKLWVLDKITFEACHKLFNRCSGSL